ncbi:MAG: HAMP domain-containing sensor histidine kinase [Proteocatella sp.]
MKSVRTKLWAGMMVLVGIVIMLIFLFQIVFLENFYSKMEVSEVERGSKTIVEEIEKLENLDGIAASESVKELIEQLSYQKQLTVQVADIKGDVAYQTSTGSNNLSPGIIKEGIAEVVSGALQGNMTSREVIHRKFGNKFIVMGFPIYEGNNIEGVLAVTFPMASVDDTANILKKQLIIITGILFFVSIVISSLLSKSFTNPILQISQMAESYTHGDFGKRLPAFDDDEIGQLAERMNQMGEALSKNEMLKKELISNVSHELRTPLTIIRGYAETLRDLTGDNPQKREKQLEVIITQSQRLGNIVEDILSLSKLQSGTEVLKLEVFSLYEMLENIRRMYEINKEERKIEIIRNLEDDYSVLGDRGKIEQVFYNFISNALRYTSAGDEIQVRLIDKVGVVRAEVEDYGEGISKEDINHIFERYYKGKQKEKKYTGTGLGLAIVKSILEMHNSKYGVESELGKGAMFWFELPKADYHDSF